MTPVEQAQILLAMVLCGAGLGAAYDALALLRRAASGGRAGCALADLVFGAVCAAGVILCALYLRVDAFRWYTLMGAAAGMALYRATLGTLLRRLCAMIGSLCRKIVPKGRNLTK